VVYPDPDLEVNAPGTGGAPGNEDLGPWQSHMAWEYGTDWVAGFLAHRRRYVTGPPPANVGLWPIGPLTHPESEESEEEGNDKGPTRAGGAQGVTAPSGPVMAPPTIVAPTVPTIHTARTAPPSTTPTPTVAPTPVATAPSAVPTTQPTTGGVNTTTTTGAHLPREWPPTIEERHPKRAATEVAATLPGPQLAAGGGPTGPAATVSAGGAQADQHWEQARAEVQRLWTLGQQLQGEAQTKTTYTGFRKTAKMAQDALEAAEQASRRARKERMASVGALPMTGLQLPGAPAVLAPSEQLEADCQEQVQALATKILSSGAAARAAVQGVQRPEGEAGARAGRVATQPGTMPPPLKPMRTVVAPATPAGQQLTRGPGGPWTSFGHQTRAINGH
jgi:hypothetical protein